MADDPEDALDALCLGCGGDRDLHGSQFCSPCEEDLPSPIRHACSYEDKLKHAIRLTSGQRFDFISASVEGKWLILEDVEGYPRTVAVRLAAIEWATIVSPFEDDPSGPQK